jgi:cyclophilin family peptidyl-prolyl cis-trans isomerase
MNQTSNFHFSNKILSLLTALIIAIFVVPFLQAAEIDFDNLPPEVILSPNQQTQPIPSSPSVLPPTNNFPSGSSRFRKQAQPQLNTNSLPPPENANPNADSSNAANVFGPEANLKTKCPTCGKKDPLALIETTKGLIIIRLYRKLAPRTVANFIDLSQKGFYNNLTFHRVVPGFVIQTGCPKGDGTGGYIEPGSGAERRLTLELSVGLKHNAPGVVAMAHAADPNSASSQFYITMAAQPNLDSQYAIFGGVVQGMDVVNQITSTDRVITVQVQERE